MKTAEASTRSFNKIFQDLREFGKPVAPRGMKVLEIEDYTYTLEPYVRFCSFPERKLKIDYVKGEFLWYLKGDKHDLSICEKASMWKTLINADGSINSNYGQYIFYQNEGQRISQFDNVVETLVKDKDSRRAAIMILGKEHLMMTTNDLPCTYCMSFRIRDNKLNMSVRMRSQDAVFGMGNDAPTFSFVQEMVYAMLLDTYPDLKLGTYTHTTDSFHIYERHFDILDALADGKCDEIDCPEISSSIEVAYLRTMWNPNSLGRMVQDSFDMPFASWLSDGKFHDAYNQ
jgi:thymidylate synthase